ncbi:MAG: lasso peptide biosynthesis B2 protein [Chloroflexota bacterium]
MRSETVSLSRINSFWKSIYFVEMILLYFLVAIRLRRYSLKKAVDLCTKLRPLTSLPNGLSTDEFVFFTRDLARSVIRWHLLSPSCIPDSLLVCWFLARRGIKAEFVIIVRNFPFMAHAQAFWNDALLTDPPPDWTIPGKFTTLMRK